MTDSTPERPPSRGRWGVTVTMSETGTIKGKKGHRWLDRGEGLIASVGLSVAATLLLTVGATTWWTMRTLDGEAHRRSEQDAVRLADRSAGVIDPLLAAGEMSTLRRYVVELGRSPEISGVRIVLPDGRVIADAEPDRIDLIDVPQTWAGTVPADADEVSGDGRGAVLRRAVSVPGRGEAACEIEVAIGGATPGLWMIQLGGVVSAAVGLGLLLVVYRRLRTRLGAIGAVREALLAMTEGETDIEALRIDAGFGAEALAWNALLSERAELERRDLHERAEAASGARQLSGAGALGVCDLLTQGVVLVGESLDVTYANGAAGVLLGSSGVSMVGALSGRLAEPQVAELIRDAVRTRSRQRSSVELDVGAGSVLRVSARGVRGRDDAAALVVIEDITQQRLAEQARSEFVAQATHELRTPLTNIRLYVEQAVDEGDDDPKVRARALNVINQEAHRLERIVGDMLSVSELEAGSMTLRTGDVRLDQFFEELRHDYEAQALEKGVALVFELPPKLPVVQADRDKLGLAVHNLIGNGLKYTQAGGSVTVRVRTRPDDALTVDVIDTGLGIGPEDQDKVFERFFRAGDERIKNIAGSGIGLTLAREVMRLHGGDITVTSEVDKGSTFSLTLPGSGRVSRAA